MQECDAQAANCRPVNWAVVAAAGAVIIAGCGESSPDRPPSEAIPALRTVTEQWSRCFEDEEAVEKVKNVVVEGDTTVTLESGEEFVIRAGSSRSEPANDAAREVAANCER